jgi:hypothetical protein
MPRNKRVAIIRKFAARSTADRCFFRRYFPELFKEAFPTSAADARSGSARRKKRDAKRQWPTNPARLPIPPQVLYDDYRTPHLSLSEFSIKEIANLLDSRARIAA